MRNQLQLGAVLIAVLCVAAAVAEYCFLLFHHLHLIYAAVVAPGFVIPLLPYSVSLLVVIPCSTLWQRELRLSKCGACNSGPSQFYLKFPQLPWDSWSTPRPPP